MDPIELTDAAEIAYQAERDVADKAAAEEAARRRRVLRDNAADLARDLFDVETDPDDWILDDLGAILEVPGDPADLAYLPSSGGDRERFVPVVRCPAGCGRYVAPRIGGSVDRLATNGLARLGAMLRSLDDRLAVCACRYDDDGRIVRDVHGNRTEPAQADEETSASAGQRIHEARERLEAVAQQDPVATVLLELVDRLDTYAARLLGEA